MQVMLTNKGPTPLPYGTPDAGGLEGLLPPGLEIAFAHERIETVIFGEQPAPPRNKFEALEIDPASPLAIEYGTDIDQWKGSSSEIAETAVMPVTLGVKNVDVGDLVITTTEGTTTLARDESAVIETLSGLKMVGQPYVPPDPGTGVTVSGFTAEQDPTVTVVGGEITNGDTIALTSTAGDAAARAKIDGYSGAVYGASGGTARLSNLDLTGQNVAGLTASAVITPIADTTGTISAFTAANPTQATMDGEDEQMLTVGGTITLQALTGDPAAMAVIDIQIVEVLSKGPVTLGIDLSAVDVTGLTADFEVNTA